MEPGAGGEAGEGLRLRRVAAWPWVLGGGGGACRAGVSSACSRRRGRRPRPRRVRVCPSVSARGEEGRRLRLLVTSERASEERGGRRGPARPLRSGPAQPGSLPPPPRLPAPRGRRDSTPHTAPRSPRLASPPRGRERKRQRSACPPAPAAAMESAAPASARRSCTRRLRRGHRGL